jgi:hypothetical protein
MNRGCAKPESLEHHRKTVFVAAFAMVQPRKGWQRNLTGLDQAASHTAVMQGAPMVRCTLGHGASKSGNWAMPKLVEMAAAAVLVVAMLAIIALVTGHLPSHTG